MDEKTAAAAAAGNEQAIREQGIAKAQAEQERVDAIVALAGMHGMNAKAEGWIRGQKSVKDVTSEIAASLREKAAAVAQPAAEGVSAGSGARDKNPRKGPFNSFGEQLMAVVASGRPGGSIDGRLLKVHELQAAATGQSVSVPSDGGFLVQTDFSTEIFTRSYETGALASRCSRTPIGENSDSLEVPYVDETSRASGSRWGGVQVQRTAEAGTPTAGKVKLGKWECRLEDLKGIVYLTDRLLRDAVAMSNFVSEAMTEEFGFVLDDEILNGDGVGKCLGILNSKALVKVAKEDGQDADTVVAENIVKMWAHCYGRSRQNAVWLYNQELDAQLPLMNVGIGTGGALIFMPPGGLSGSPYGTLYGRPLIPVEQAAAPGDTGDIVLADLSQYKLIDKDGLQAASSVHVRFIYDETCFKFGMRVNGAPKWKTSLTPYKGSSGFYLSPFVALATR